MDEAQKKQRYKNSLDTLSLQDDDDFTPSAEDVAAGDLGFVEIMKQLQTDRQRFIALALYIGWNKVEIARMIDVDPSDIGYFTRRMQVKLATYHIHFKRKFTP